MATINTFPELIFVTVEENESDKWMSANLTKLDSLGDSRKAIVGLYKFIHAEQVTQGMPVFTKRRTRATK